MRRDNTSPPHDADAGRNSGRGSGPRKIHESNPGEVDLGHTHKGVALVKLRGWLPNNPKPYQWRWYTIINTLLRGRWITQRELFEVAQQNNPGGPIFYLRHTLGWPVLSCPWQRPAHLHDETDETTRSDLYYLPPVFIDYFFSVRPKTDWDKLVPAKARVQKNLGSLPTAGQKAKAAAHLRHKIEMHQANLKRATMEERREDDWFENNKATMDPRARGPEPDKPTEPDDEAPKPA